MKITENVEILELEIPRGASVSRIYPTLTWDDNHLVLFDTGYPQTEEFFQAAIKKAGFDLADVTDIILTHQDVDHIGGCLELLKVAKNATVYAHEVDTPFIEGKKVPTKLDQLEQKAQAGTLLKENEGFYQMLKNGFAGAYLPVDVTLTDGQILDFCGGIQTVFTPGHTPGHASFYLAASQIMICGDAANVAGQELIGSSPRMTWDMALAEVSLEKIKSFSPKACVAYHTGYLKL